MRITTQCRVGLRHCLMGAGLAVIMLFGAAGPLAAQTSEAEPAPSVGDAMDLATPLAPAKTGSPRQTFVNFRNLVRGAARDLDKAFALSEDDDAFFDSPQVQKLKREASAQLYRAATTLDLSAIAPANRGSIGVNAVLLLEEVLDRLPAIDVAQIPDAAAIAAGAAPRGWTVPGTQLRMMRLEAPSGEPRFLFSTDTVARLHADYELIRTFPKSAPDAIDLYKNFVAGPGLVVPTEFYNYILDLPPWTRELYYDQAVWQWIALTIVTIMVVVATWIIVRWELKRSPARGDLARALGRLLAPLAVILLLGLYDAVIDDLVNLTGNVLASAELVIETIQTLVAAAFLLLTFNALAALVVASPRIKSESLDASLIRLIFRSIGFIVAGYVIFMGATRIGLPVYGVVAGLGVGGLAIALAVRPTLENFVGGIILYADRPVRVGDFCKFGNMVGTVEAIGLRSTKVRGLDRTLVTVQNSEFSQLSITNFSRRDSNLLHTNIGLRYETTAQQLRAIIADTDEMLRTDERIQADTVRVRFRNIGDYSLDLELWAYVDTDEWAQFLKVQEDVFFKVMEIVERNGSAFALPSQTTYLGTNTLSPSASAQEASDADRLMPAAGLRS
ncbi:MAG: mechanosensitive ion channel family protein [Devosia sp.]